MQCPERDCGSNVNGWCQIAAEDGKPPASCTLNALVVPLMVQLRQRGWCIVLKALPPGIGWLLEGSRSEYDAPCPDQRIAQGMWCAEAQWIGNALERHFIMRQSTFGENPSEALQRLAEACEAELSRHNAESESSSE